MSSVYHAYDNHEKKKHAKMIFFSVRRAVFLHRFGLSKLASFKRKFFFSGMFSRPPLAMCQVVFPSRRRKILLKIIFHTSVVVTEGFFCSLLFFKVFCYFKLLPHKDNVNVVIQFLIVQ